MRRTGIVLATLCLLALAMPAEAARGRYHYVPADPHGNVTPAPRGPRCNFGERFSVLGICTDANPPCPTCYHTFCHPCTGVHITIPLSLPDDTPQILHRRNRVIYNYGSYAVEVNFLPDGSVDVIYNSGLLRAL